MPTEQALQPLCKPVGVVLEDEVLLLDVKWLQIYRAFG
jgi:hypothetical protein